MHMWEQCYDNIWIIYIFDNAKLATAVDMENKAVLLCIKK